MFHYLYYKLYQATLKGSLSDIAEFAASIYFGGLIAANIFVIGGFLAKLNLVSFYTSKQQAGLSAIICIVLSCIYFLYNKKYESIVYKYSQEDNRTRIKGNIIVSLYVAISFLLIFAVGLFKSGKL